MKNIQIACYALMASMFVLAGLLLVRLPAALEEKAQAEMVINRQNFTLMTAQTKDGEEALFVLNNVNDRLLIYTMNVARKELEVVGNEDMARQFSLTPVGGAAGGREGR